MDTIEALRQKIADLEAINSKLVKEIVQLKDLKTKSEQRYMLFFRIIGAIAFVAATFETFYSMIAFDMEEVHMSNMRIGWAITGFVLYAGNPILGKLANELGKVLLSWIKKWTGTRE